MVDRLSSELGFTQDALRLRAYRQEVITSNIANADTPNYKARDFDFNATLAQAVERTETPDAGSSDDGALVRTSARHFAGQALSSAGSPELAYRVPQQQSIDGNTVELNAERVKFADNAVHYETDLTVMTNQIKTMLAAIEQNS